MRVVELDMTNSNHQCPGGLRQRTYSEKRTCISSSNSAGCSAVIFPTRTSNYTKVCGKITAYQVGTTDTFGIIGRPTNPNINSNYVDGISLTHGSPRHHI